MATVKLLGWAVLLAVFAVLFVGAFHNLRIPASAELAGWDLWGAFMCGVWFMGARWAYRHVRTFAKPVQS